MIKYFKVDCRPRYWEDSSVNGTDDISWEDQKKGIEPAMPFHVKDRGRGEGEYYKLAFTIELESGNILDWPNDTYANMFYKVCDDGHYSLLDEDMNVIHEADCYVPGLLDTTGESYGDYIEISKISNDGHIQFWHKPERLQDKIEEFLNTKSFDED